MRQLPQVIKFLASAIFMLIPMTASAGDFAEIRIVGFSNDGAIFAFDEFGVQDGSGFPYANRYFIDTRTDTYLPGTPFRAIIKDEAAGLGAVRAKVASDSAALVASHGLNDNPGILAAFSPASEFGSDKTMLRYNAFAVVPPVNLPFTVILEEKSLPARPACQDFVDPVMGFRLSMIEAKGEATNIVLHDDKSVPSSRNCPQGYQLGGAVTHMASDGSLTHAILVLVRSFGFEGSDGRWLAVTKRFDD